MKGYSERAERAMKTAADLEGVPAGLQDGIMRAVRCARREAPTAFFLRGRLCWWSAAACAGVLIATGVWRAARPPGPAGVGPAAPEVARALSFSDLNPVSLVPAGVMQEERRLIGEDLRRAVAFLTEQVEDRVPSAM